MKLARFQHGEDILHGIVYGDEIAAITGTFFDALQETGKRYPLAQVKLLTPVRPSKIVCIGLNYRKHIEEVGMQTLDTPHFFLKPPSSLIGPEDPIVIPKHAERVDYEGELGLVIKRPMRNVPQAEALAFVLGYTCFNDVTERALVMKSLSYLSEAKGFDTFGAVGPYVATDLDPDHLEVKTLLNGEIKQQDNTDSCLFKVPYLLHYISRCMTLLPGDIVATGTPHGIAPMKAGDRVEVEIERIGTLGNPVVSDLVAS